MSKYFLKWLPVEGEIKDGDKTLLRKKDGTYAIFTRMKEDDPNWKSMTNTLGHIPLQLDEKPSYVQYTHPKDLKKFKLFLCSHDIQVGDEIKGPIYEQDITAKSHELLRGAYKNCFKDIGEISPAAYSFAKEGMEFEEDELCCFISTGFGSGTQDHILPFTIEKGQNKLYYGVKGPCGHFH